jgi:hypothetical protein
LVERLRREVAELEIKRDEFVERNKKKIFDWSSFVLNSPTAPKELDLLKKHDMTQDVRDILVRYEQMNQEIMEKEAVLSEKLDEQARFDSLG